MVNRSTLLPNTVTLKNPFVRHTVPLIAPLVFKLYPIQYTRENIALFKHMIFHFHARIVLDITSRRETFVYSTRRNREVGRSVWSSISDVQYCRGSYRRCTEPQNYPKKSPTYNIAGCSNKVSCG